MTTSKGLLLWLGQAGVLCLLFLAIAIVGFRACNSEVQRLWGNFAVGHGDVAGEATLHPESRLVYGIRALSNYVAVLDETEQYECFTASDKIAELWREKLDEQAIRWRITLGQQRVRHSLEWIYGLTRQRIRVCAYELNAPGHKPSGRPAAIVKSVLNPKLDYLYRSVVGGFFQSWMQFPNPFKNAFCTLQAGYFQNEPRAFDLPQLLLCESNPSFRRVGTYCSGIGGSLGGNEKSNRDENVWNRKKENRPFWSVRRIPPMFVGLLLYYSGYLFCFWGWRLFYNDGHRRARLWGALGLGLGIACLSVGGSFTLFGYWW